jgi:hypothetical protein
MGGPGSGRKPSGTVKSKLGILKRLGNKSKSFKGKTKMNKNNQYAKGSARDSWHKLDRKK